MKMLKKFLVSVVAVVCLAFSGCSQKEESSNLLMENLDQVQGLEDYAPSTELSKSFSKTVSYHIANVQWEGDSGKAEVVVKAPDLKKAIETSIEKAIEECGTDDYDKLLEEAKKNLQDLMNSQELDTIETTVEVDAVKDGEEIVLISNDEFEDAIKGNLGEIFLEVLMEGMDNE